MSLKLKDPRNFSVPCAIGTMNFGKALCADKDMATLMPLSVYEKLGLDGMNPPRISLQLEDKSVNYPIGIEEYVHIRIWQLIIPINFIVLDIREDTGISILLGRPFLSTTEVIIEVKRGKLTLEVGDENIEFLLSKIIKSLPLMTLITYST